MKNKILVGLAIVIIIGIIIITFLGFNVDICYRNYNLVDIKIGQDFNINDIKQITNEVFPKKSVEIQKAGVYSDNLVIKVNEISDEQKNTLNTKINEKYGINNTVDDIQVHYIPSNRLRDIIKPYIVPMLITTALILVYISIRFRKLGIGKVLSQAIILTIIAEALYISIIAITRFPINRLVIPVAIVIYITIITVLTGMFEKQKKLLEK